MPPPDVRRPPLAEYEGLRDWLEAEIDRHAATRSNPGAVVLHRLNRTEYANAIRDLLDLEIDVTALLPPDDSARLRQHRGFADDLADAARVVHDGGGARRAHGGRLLEVADRSHLSRARATPRRTSLEGMPFGTRGGIVGAPRLSRPTASTSSRFRTSASAASFRASSSRSSSTASARTSGRTEASGVESGMTADGDGTLEVTVPVQARARAWSARRSSRPTTGPSLDIDPAVRPEVAREQHASRSCSTTRRSGSLRIQGPFNAQRPDGLARAVRKVFTCRPATAPPGRAPARRQILTTLARRAYRRPPTARRLDDADGVLRAKAARAARSRTASSWRCGGCWRARSSWCAPSSEPANAARRAGLSHHRPGAGVAPVVLPVEQHSRRRADHRGQPGTAEPAARCSSSRCGACSPIRAPRRWSTNFAQQLLYLRNLPATSPDGVFYPELGRRAAPELPARDGAVLREHHPRGPQRRRSADRGLHVRQRAAGAGTTAFRTSTARTSAA